MAVSYTQDEPVFAGPTMHRVADAAYTNLPTWQGLHDLIKQLEIIGLIEEPTSPYGWMPQLMLWLAVEFMCELHGQAMPSPPCRLLCA